MEAHNFLVKRIIVSTVAMSAILLLFTIAVLSFRGMPVPDPLDRLGNIALGALIGLLAKTTADKSETDTPSAIAPDRSGPDGSGTSSS